MLGFRKTNPNIAKLLEATDKAQGLINDLHQADPANATFKQTGILDGREIIQDYIEHNEWGVALEHLLYMIHESEITFAADELYELHSIASRMRSETRTPE